jgi:catechol 2,3-dioxygenase-like lactoylglutathione lyase family enzyme
MTISSAVTPATISYLEHVAIRVRDMHWHVRFFREVLGHELREVDGTLDAPRQYWTLGGLQFMASPDFEAPPSNDAGWLAHLGLMVDDLEAALQAAQAWQVKALPQGRNWLQLPDGLAIELMQAAPQSVAKVLAVKPRG